MEFKGGGAASGACMETNAEAQARAAAEDRLMSRLQCWADPIPGPAEFLTGIEHKNDNPKNAGVKWDVPRAIGSRKMHYLPRLQGLLANDPTLPILNSFPDLSSASGGRQRLTAAGWRILEQEFGVKNEADYIKHILTYNDGEVRVIEAISWLPFPASGGSVNQACFWHYQFAGTAETRRYLYNRGQEAWYQQDLSDTEVDSWTDNAAKL